MAKKKSTGKGAGSGNGSSTGEAEESFFRHKDTMLKKILHWQNLLNVGVAEDVAAAKEKRRDIAALEKRGKELVMEDNLELFPGAEIAEPKALASRATLWTVMDWKRSAGKVQVMIEVAKIKEADYVAQYMCIVHSLNKQKTWFRAGDSRQKATAQALNELKKWASSEGKAHKGDVREDFGHLLEKLEKAERDIPPLVQPVSDEWVPPLQEGVLMREQDLVAAAIAPDFPWKPDNWQQAEGIIANFRGSAYFVLGIWSPVDVPIHQLEATLLRAVPEKGWGAKIVNTKDECPDGQLCGLRVTAKGQTWVLDQQNTQIRVRAYHVEDSDDMRSADGVLPELDGFDPKLLGKLSEAAGERAAPVEDDQIAEINGRHYLNAGTLDNETGPGVYWLIPLEDPAAFRAKYPEFTKPKVSLDKRAWWGHRVTYRERQWMIGHPDNALLVRYVPRAPVGGKKRASAAEKSQEVEGLRPKMLPDGGDGGAPVASVH